MCQISVIVPTFNRAAVLPRALASIARQSFRYFEVLVYDDGSTDDTTAVLEEWSARWPERQTGRALKSNPSTPAPSLTLIRGDTNIGVSHARNRAAAQARGRWLAFLDSDDEWLPDKLERQMRLAHENPHLPLIHGEEIWIRRGVRVNPMRKHGKNGGRLFRRCVDLCCISPSATLIHRDLFERLGGFREDFPVCEDYELWLRVCARHEVGFVTEPVIRKYGGHPDQLSRRYKAMDYYRAKALLPFLDPSVERPEGLTITEEEREHARRTTATKCRILLNGYLKHGNMAHFAEVESWSRLCGI